VHLEEDRMMAASSGQVALSLGTGGRRCCAWRLFGRLRPSTTHDDGPFVPTQSFGNFPKRFQDLKLALVVSFSVIEQLNGSVRRNTYCIVLMTQMTLVKCHDCLNSAPRRR
jgi:hypothetical protein